jgi:hypothetical protein
MLKVEYFICAKMSFVCKHHGQTKKIELNGPALEDFYDLVVALFSYGIEVEG